MILKDEEKDKFVKTHVYDSKKIQGIKYYPVFFLYTAHFAPS